MKDPKRGVSCPFRDRGLIVTVVFAAMANRETDFYIFFFSPSALLKLVTLSERLCFPLNVVQLVWLSKEESSHFY